MPGGAWIKAAEEIADCSLRSFPLRQIAGFQQIVQPDYAVSYQKLRQKSLGILPTP